MLEGVWGFLVECHLFNSWKLEWALYRIDRFQIIRHLCFNGRRSFRVTVQCIKEGKKRSYPLRRWQQLVEDQALGLQAFL